MGNFVRPEPVTNLQFAPLAELSTGAELAAGERRQTLMRLWYRWFSRPSSASPPWRDRIESRRGPTVELTSDHVGKKNLLLAGIAVLFCLRSALAFSLPLSFDEAYYWLWSRHLALGYFDHPAAIAIAVRAGTSLFGDTEFGVRFVPLTVSVLTTWAVWRAAAVILADETAGAVAALLFNCTLMIAAESLAATPDALLIAAAALTLWFIAKLEQTRDGRWWLAAGGAMGLGIAAKYTGFFLCGSVALWLAWCAVDRARVGSNWLRTPWPYAGTAIALAMFAPTIYWNATHAFVSFRFQFGRIATGHFGLIYLFEFVGSQLALASPGVLLLAGFGAFSGERSSRCPRVLALLSLSVCVPLAYFALHSLHDRVQGNWPCFVYPGLAILAAAGFREMPAGSGGAVRLVRIFALPVSCLILGIAYVQAYSGFIHLGRIDPIARMTAVGFTPVAERIEADAKRVGAHAIITTNYPVTSWLKFYERSRFPIIQIGDDVRFLSSPSAARSAVNGTLLYVTQHARRELPLVLAHFSRAKHLEKLVRSRSGEAIDMFDTFEIDSFRGGLAGRAP